MDWSDENIPCQSCSWTASRLRSLTGPCPFTESLYCCTWFPWSWTRRATTANISVSSSDSSKDVGLGRGDKWNMMRIEARNASYDGGDDSRYGCSLISGSDWGWCVVAVTHHFPNPFVWWWWWRVWRIIQRRPKRVFLCGILVVG
jgi:hypothetical protein